MERRWLRICPFLCPAIYFRTRSVTCARAHLPDQVLEHLIGRDFAQFLPNQVLEHSATLFLALKRSHRVLEHSATLFLPHFSVRACAFAVSCWHSLENFGHFPLDSHSGSEPSARRRRCAHCARSETMNSRLAEISTIGSNP
ncbi:MAG: hypothetical protein J6Y32_00535 [Bacteroidales bacterium]|nr:hypothetical protein [Bacteroidales bacterium]